MPEASQSSPTFNMHSDRLPLISDSNNASNRFNPYFLKNEQKIEILIKAYALLSQMHANRKTLSEEFNGDHVLISHSESGEITLEFSEQGITTTNEEEFDAKKLNDATLLVSTLEKGLNLQSPMLRAIMAYFVQRGKFSEIEYKELLTILESLKSVKHLGLDVFGNIPFPQIEPNNEKNIFCVAARNVFDGIGDFEHAWDFASKVKPLLNQMGYRVFGLIEADSSIPGSVIYDRCNYVLNKLKHDNSPFDDYLCYPTDENYEEWLKQHAAEISTLQTHVAGAAEISYPTRLSALFPSHVNVIKSHQYGKLYDTDYPSLSLAPMGIPGTRNLHSYGIKIQPQPQSEPSTESPAVLLSLHVNEPEFIQNLLYSQNPDHDSATAYLQNHHFMPAYLQTHVAACSFILTQALRYQNDGKKCDFFLPKNVIDEEVIKQLLEKNGISPNDVAFIYPGSTVDHSQAKIRIFSFRIKNDEDYKKLYQISSDGAGASGDNSISILFSSQHFPWYQFKSGPIGRFYTEELLKLVQICEHEAATTNNPALLEGMKVLKEYFLHLNDLKNNDGFYFPESLDGETDYASKMLNETIKNQILDETFSNHCLHSAKHLENHAIKIAWEYVLRRIHQGNFYNEIDNLAKASIITSNYPSEYVASILSNSEEIANLGLTNILPLEDLKHLPWKSLVLMTDPLLQELIAEMGMSAKTAGDFFKLIASDNYAKKIDARNFLEKIKQMNLTKDEKEILFSSPVLPLALYTGILLPENLISAKSIFMEAKSIPHQMSGAVMMGIHTGRIFNTLERYKNNPEIYIFLQDMFKTAFVNMKDEGMLNQPGVNGKTILMLAAENGDIKAIEILCESGANLNFVDEQQHPALWHALSAGQVKAALKLIELGAFIPPNTLLDFSIKLNNNELLEKSLELGANIHNLANDYPPLIFAIQSGYQKNVETLLKAHANLNFTLPHGITLPEFANNWGHRAIADKLEYRIREIKWIDTVGHDIASKMNMQNTQYDYFLKSIAPEIFTLCQNNNTLEHKIMNDIQRGNTDIINFIAMMNTFTSMSSKHKFELADYVAVFNLAKKLLPNYTNEVMTLYLRAQDHLTSEQQLMIKLSSTLLTEERQDEKLHAYVYEYNRIHPRLSNEECQLAISEIRSALDGPIVRAAPPVVTNTASSSSSRKQSLLFNAINEEYKEKFQAKAKARSKPVEKVKRKNTPKT